MRLIDAEQYRREFLNSRDFEPMKILDFQPTVQAIPIPEGTTNGDMIKAMFPQYNYEEINYKLRTSEDEWKVSSKKVRMHSEQIVDFESDWWNTPYKGDLK